MWQQIKSEVIEKKEIREDGEKKQMEERKGDEKEEESLRK